MNTNLVKLENTTDAVYNIIKPVNFDGHSDILLNFDEVELNWLLVLVQDKITFTNSNWGIPFVQRAEMNKLLKNLEVKILKMLEE